MEKLKLQPWATVEQARNEYSPANVYVCPKCNTGLHLQNISIPSDKAKCTQCNEIYLKP